MVWPLFPSVYQSDLGSQVEAKIEGTDLPPFHFLCSQLCKAGLSAPVISFRPTVNKIVTVNLYHYSLSDECVR